MITFLSQEWLDHLRTVSADLPRPPVGSRTSGTIRQVVRDGPQGVVTCVMHVAEGSIAEATLGDTVAADAADLNFTVSYEDAVRVARGEVSVGAAYMQGNLKVEGDMGMLFDLLPCTHRQEFQDFIGKVASETDF
jgi:hypothetical protein